MEQIKRNDMKTAVTVIKTHQVGYDSFEDERITKVFDDNTTILEIKEWTKGVLNLKIPIDEVGLSGSAISNVSEEINQ